MKNYEAKWAYLTSKTKGICPIAKDKEGWAEPATELHHIIHNTKVNRKLYPLLIDSVWNLVAVNHYWHMKYPTFGRPYGWQMKAVRREAFLERHPMIAKAVNMEGRNGI